MVGLKQSNPVKEPRKRGDSKNCGVTHGKHKTFVQDVAEKILAFKPQGNTNSQVVTSNTSPQSGVSVAKEHSSRRGSSKPVKKRDTPVGSPKKSTSNSGWTPGTLSLEDVHSSKSYSSVLSQASPVLAPIVEEIPPKSTKTAPHYGGASYKLTEELANLADNKNPIMAKSFEVVQREEIPKGVKHAARKSKWVVTNEELHYYLLIEFACVPRTPTIFRSMVVKARAYLKEHDMRFFTTKEAYATVMQAVRTAIPISTEEALLRQSLKHDGVVDYLEKNEKLLVDGLAGKSGTLNIFKGFKTSHSIPKDRK